MTAVILLTRPRSASERFAKAFRAADAQRPAPDRAKIVIAPLVDIAPQGGLPDMRAYRGLVFTSQNGLSEYLRLGGRIDLPAYCVGNATAAAARGAGMTAISAQGDAEALIGHILQRAAAGPLLHLRGAQGRGDVAARLTQAGLACDEAILYAQYDLPVGEEIKALAAGHGATGAPIIVPVFSPLGAARLAHLPDFGAPLWVLAISDAAASALTGPRPARVAVAEAADPAAMIAGLKRLCDAAVSP